MKKQKIVRFALRAPADSYRRWQELAAAEGRSMNSQIRIVMDAYQLQRSITPGAGVPKSSS